MASLVARRDAGRAARRQRGRRRAGADLERLSDATPRRAPSRAPRGAARGLPPIGAGRRPTSPACSSRYLLAALTQANCVARWPRHRSPSLLDDPFARVPAERKWELMDMLRRLAEKTQLLYLTDDPFVGAWARRRADSRRPSPSSSPSRLSSARHASLGVATGRPCA